MATPASLALAKTQQKRLAQVESQTYSAGNVIYGGVEYPASAKERLHQELYYFARIGSYDITHYIYDKNGTQVSLNLYQMKAILDLMEKLEWVVNVNLDTHKDAIDAQGTIAAVLAYDYTGGYPVMPYTG